jgi:hypothetical protein
MLAIYGRLKEIAGRWRGEGIWLKKEAVDGGAELRVMGDSAFLLASGLWLGSTKL